MADAYTKVIDGVPIGAELTASGSYYVKSATYATEGTININNANTFIKFEPGTILTMNTFGFSLNANNCHLEFGPGCVLTNSSGGRLVLGVVGSGNHIRFKNGCTLANIIIGVTADQTTIDGGGWGTVCESIRVRGDDCVVKHAAWDSKTPGTGLSAIQVSTSTVGRAQILNNKVIDSDEHGIEILDPECLLFGNTIIDADGDGVLISADRCRVNGNSVQVAVAGADINITSDDNVIDANSCNGAIINTGSDQVIVANQVGSIADSSTNSIVQFNNAGTGSCAVTGTFQSAVNNESDILNGTHDGGTAGGETLVLTLTNGSWRNQTMAVLATAFQALLTGNHGEANSWENEKSVILATGTVVRTSATVMTITFVSSAYAITATDEIVTLANLDETVLETESSITPDDVSYTILVGV